MPIKIFFDGANLEEMLFFYKNDPRISGFTTNPTLMRKAGITDYERFAKSALTAIADYPISFEVFSDDLAEMEKQAKKIASWGENVYVKIPITNTQSASTVPIIRSLSAAGVKLNITAVFTVSQVAEIASVVDPKTPIIISIFAGRIANAGVDPMPIMSEAIKQVQHYPQCEILWASPREAFNIVQAEAVGCHIITLTKSLLIAADNFGKPLDVFSLETVKMFYEDALTAGYVI